MERLRSLARSQCGSINDVLMAAYFLSLSDLTGHNGPQSLFFPVDLRRYMPPGGRIMTNQSINVNFNLARERGEVMPSLLRKIVKETTRMKAGKLGVRETVAFDRGCDPAGISMRRMEEAVHALEHEGLADVFISNPGRLDLPEIPGLKNVFIGYPGGYMPTTCFLISSFNGSMTITMGYQDDEEPRQATWRMMRSFLDHLSMREVEIH